MQPDHHHEALRQAGFEITQPTPYYYEDEQTAGFDAGSDIYGNLIQDDEEPHDD